MGARLPPPPGALAGWPRGPRPLSSADRVRRRGPPGLCRLTAAPAGASAGEEEAAPPLRGGEGSILLLHCFDNRRASHMIGRPGKRKPPLAFPEAWAPALGRLLEATEP